jgi:prepilin-type N-terminal cleavage/methylation domain-containing protein
MYLRFPTGTRRRAFSLLEVMVAIAIFSVASFAILSLISSSLANVRRLQRPMVDASPVLARFASMKKLTNGIYSGSLGDPELLGKEYQGYNWTASIEQYQLTNNLFIVECVVQSASGNHEVISHLSTLLYRPDSSDPPGPFDRGIGMKGR